MTDFLNEKETRSHFQGGGYREVPQSAPAPDPPGFWKMLMVGGCGGLVIIAVWWAAMEYAGR